VKSGKIGLVKQNQGDISTNVGQYSSVVGNSLGAYESKPKPIRLH